MDTFFDILKLILPAGIVFLTAFYAIKKFLDNEQKKRLINLRKNGHTIITPIRLQAYERVTMFLERISPHTLINSSQKQGISARMLQAEMISTIKNEFNHNLSQQVYMSNEAWLLVKKAKEEMIKMINVTSFKVGGNATGSDLSKVILQIMMKMDKLPTEVAIDFLKAELRELF